MAYKSQPKATVIFIPLLKKKFFFDKRNPMGKALDVLSDIRWICTIQDKQQSINTLVDGKLELCHLAQCIIPALQTSISVSDTQEI